MSITATGPRRHVRQRLQTTATHSYSPYRFKTIIFFFCPKKQTGRSIQDFRLPSPSCFIRIFDIVETYIDIIHAPYCPKLRIICLPCC